MKPNRPSQVGPAFEPERYASRSFLEFLKMMRKNLFVVTLLMILFISTSGYNEQRFETSILRSAPIETVKNSNNEFTIGGRNGRYTLVTFWESGDARSRQQANEYAALFHSNQAISAKIDFVGVNFDTESVIFDEIVANDNLNPASQYNVEGRKAEKLMSVYELYEGYGSMLLDPNGTIVAFNPSADQLAQL